MISRTQTLIAMVVMVAMLAIGCVIPPAQTMVDTDFVGERTVEYLLVDPLRESVEDQEDPSFFSMLLAADEERNPNYYFAVRICDVGTDGQQANCETSEVLRNVRLPGESVEVDEEDDDSARQVSTVFWYDAETLFVSYEDYVPGLQVSFRPRVQKCSLVSGNRLECSDQHDLDDKLEFTEDLM